MPAAETPKDPGYKWIVMVIVMIGMVMATLDSSIVNVSIPKIMSDFASNVTDIEWVVTAYMIGFAVLMPLTAWLRERIGNKILYTSSLVLFTVGSLLCGMSLNLPLLICARVVQALGGGAMSPTGMSMITDVFEPKERGKAMGFFGLAFVIGPAIGPTIGGFLTETFGWRSIFFVNLPIGIIGSLVAWELLKNDRHLTPARRKFDTWGFVFLSIMLVSFLLGISRGETEGWTSRYILTCGFFFLASLASFIVAETLVKNRIMDLSLFKNPVFSIAMLVNGIRSVALFGGIFLLPLFLQQLKGLTAIQSGIMMIPGTLMVAVFMPIVGWLTDKSSPRFLVIAGMVILAISMYMYKDISIYMNNWEIIFPTMVRGVGLAFLMSPIMTLALNSVPNHKTAMASSMLSIMMQVGGAAGIAILSTVLDTRTTFHLRTISAGMTRTSPSMMSTMGQIQHSLIGMGYSHMNAMMGAMSIIAKQVYIISANAGFQDAFVFATFMILVSLVPAIFLPNKFITSHKQKSNVVME